MKVNFTFDPFEMFDLPRPKTKADRQAALEEIGEYVRTEILQYVGDGKSPVSGGAFKKSLSPEYKKIKDKISSADFANLELTGDMLDALEFRVEGNKIKIGVFDPTQIPKAYNHNVGDTLPQRQFIPEQGEKFKSPIEKGMREIAESFVDESD